MARGWISGVDPLTFDPDNVVFDSNGLSLFLLQVLIILSLCYVLGSILQRLGQPRVLGELLAGVILGPTAFGKIPNFSNTIVPPNALPLLSLTSVAGLILFILLVGLETDTDMIQRHIKKVALIALPGMAIPFAISVGLAQYVYVQSTDQSTEFTTFMLFVATVMAVTSLSVLSRVLSEMQLIQTLLGSVTIAAGALNDLIGYILLALGSSLASGGKQINALLQLLVALALFLLQWFAIRPLMFWMIGRSAFDINGSSKQRVPQFLLVFTLLGAFISAWITEACNLHPILGALLFGIACPHGNFGVMITEEIEVVTMQILLPLYYVISGLKADFTLLNTGKIWGELIMVFAVVWISKFLATTLSTRLAGFRWREAAFVASLMQSKSIIELIILNAGRELGVLNAQVYSMLFVTFLLSTLTVRPLATFIWKSQKGMCVEEAGVQSSGDDTMSKGGAPGTADHKGANEKSPEPHWGSTTPLPILAALGSGTQSVEPLTAFMQLSAGRPSAVVMDVVRISQHDSSTANILRSLTTRHDDVLDAVKVIAAMQATPLFDVQKHDMGELISGTSDEDVIDGIRRRARALEQVYKADTRTTSADIGPSVAIVSWENNVHLGPTHGDVAEADESDAQPDGLSSGYFAKTNTLAARLFHSCRKDTTGVLVDATTALDQVRRRKGHVLATDVHAACAPHAIRIVVPFFGGSDDRACVALARRLMQSDAVEVVVVQAEERKAVLADEVIRMVQGERFAAKHDEASEPQSPRKHQRAATQGSQQNEEANAITINLQTVNQPQERHKDARALFAVKDDEDILGAASREADSDVSPRQRVERRNGVLFVSLTEYDVRATQTGSSLEAVLAYCASLTDSRAGDMVFVGRGKLHQRTADFREQVRLV